MSETQTIGYTARYKRLLRQFIVFLDHWSMTSGGTMVARSGRVYPSYASSKSRELKELEDGLIDHPQEFDESQFNLLKTEFMEATYGARHVSGNKEWVGNAMSDAMDI